MENFRDWLGIISSIGAIIAMIILFYRTFRDPDIKTDKSIDIMQERCKLTHTNLDEKILSIHENMDGINKTFALFKENEFRHIEDRMNGLEKGQVRIETMLNERLPKK